jgi:F-type H+/Na+-transporting ATPase subunit alpha
VLVIYAANKGVFDDLPLEHCRPFERELYRQFDQSHGDLLKQVTDSKGLTPELSKELDAAIDEVKKQFVPPTAAPAKTVKAPDEAKALA